MMTWSRLKVFRDRLNTRSIFSETRTWPIVCAFNNDCTFDMMKEIERKWKPASTKGDAKISWKTDKPFKYVLSMFPYPSGSLHLGHVKIYTSADIISRFFKMTGHEVVNPMGWDSFGLPAENAAFERGANPKEWTYSNIQHMKSQLESLSLDTVSWREATSDPSFYKWTQWLIIQLFKHNLLYRSRAQVNWDPIDNTVLADDQVDADGRSWRSGAKVEKRYLTQWFVKTSAFVKDCFEAKDMDTKNGINLEQVLRSQRDWMGKSLEGFAFYFPVDGSNILPVYSSMMETIMQDDVHVLVSPDHWIIESGIRTIINPFTEKSMDIKVTDQPMKSYFKAIISSASPTRSSQNIQGKVLEKVLQDESLGCYPTTPAMGDWLISRQRYWGTPIPIVHCPTCGPQSVSEESLPVELPEVTDFRRLQEKREDATSKLAEVAPPEWLATTCPKCGHEAKRETDTLDTFVDSSWYYLRFATEDGPSSQPFDKDFWSRNRVSVYLGGPEHFRGHLLSSRYIYHFLRRYNYLSNVSAEPYDQFLLQGIVTSKVFKEKVTGKYLTQADMDGGQFKKEDVEVRFEKMSKSKGNGVDPLELIEKFGIDATRLTVIGQSSSQKDRLWRGIEPEFQETTKFLRKLLLVMDEFFLVRTIRDEDPVFPEPRRIAIKSLSTTGESLTSVLKAINFNRNETIISVTVMFGVNYRLGRGSKKIQELTEFLRRYSRFSEVSLSAIFERTLADLIIMSYPIMPHLSQELWAAFTSGCSASMKNFYQLDKTVDVQSFPVPESDHPIPIKVMIDGDTDNIISIPVDRKVINIGDKGHILEIVMDQLLNVHSDVLPESKNITSDHVKLQVHPGYRAVAIVRTSNSTFKFRGKLGKKKKKTHKDDEEEPEID